MDNFTNFGLDAPHVTRVSDYNVEMLPGVSRALLMCGICAKPAVYHVADMEEDNKHNACDRILSEFPSEVFNDFFLHNTGITAYVDLAGQVDTQYEVFKFGIDYDNEDGTFTNFRPEEDPALYINYEEREHDALMRWADKDPSEVTQAIDAWYVSPQGEYKYMAYSEDHPRRKVPVLTFEGPRTAFVEGTAGFISRSIIDPIATRNYQARLLNSFINKKTGKFHVGSIALDFAGDRVTATCVNRDCERRDDLTGRYEQAAWVFDRSLVTDRTLMETIVYTIIRHGNNHGPNWLRERADFYLMHDFACDLDHENPVLCNHNRVVTDSPDTDLNDVEFVMEHQRYCNDANCKCDEWLANEVPVLARSAA